MKSIFQNKALSAVIIILLVANLGLLAYYCFFRGRGENPHRHPVTEFVKNDVGFDDKQMKSFEESKVKYKERMRQLIEESGKAKDSFYMLILTSNLDDSLLFDRALNVGDKQRAIEMEMYRQFKGIQAMCKPEQLSKFDSRFLEMAKKIYRPMRGKDSSDHK